ncbi:hypothetical protein [Candidatus Paracaedibacter symbiosus]|uniref:hypothetical protein n=1 Tax=Candidatus Paracaedibacter symbiosus TaxID=244582 RepID=UPI0005095BC5|nr:hypothetical protein [Candidatus Paracaedibacter symbiosus]
MKNWPTKKYCGILESAGNSYNLFSSLKTPSLQYPKFLAQLCLITTAFATFPTCAISNDWTGTISTDWFNPGNWSAGTPNASTSTIVDTAATNSTLISGSAATSNDIALWASLVQAF